MTARRTRGNGTQHAATGILGDTLRAEDGRSGQHGARGGNGTQLAVTGMLDDTPRAGDRGPG